MPGVEFADLTARAAAEAAEDGAVLILPVGSMEPHGPHLPLATGVYVANAMAARAVGRLRARGLEAFRLPAISFGGGRRTSRGLAVEAGALTDTIEGMVSALAGSGFDTIGIANWNLAGEHVAALEEMVARVESSTGVRIALPSATDDPWAPRLARVVDDAPLAEGHGGMLETSVLLVVAPDLVGGVREDLHAAGGDGPIGSGGYRGDPARASEEVGESVLGVLAEMIATAIVALDGDDDAAADDAVADDAVADDAVADDAAAVDDDAEGAAAGDESTGEVDTGAVEKPETPEERADREFSDALAEAYDDETATRELTDVDIEEAETQVVVRRRVGPDVTETEPFDEEPESDVIALGDREEGEPEIGTESGTDSGAAAPAGAASAKNGGNAENAGSAGSAGCAGSAGSAGSVEAVDPGADTTELELEEAVTERLATGSEGSAPGDDVGPLDAF